MKQPTGSDQVTTQEEKIAQDIKSLDFNYAQHAQNLTDLLGKSPENPEHKTLHEESAKFSESKDPPSLVDFMEFLTRSVSKIDSQEAKKIQIDFTQDLGKNGFKDLDSLQKLHEMTEAESALGDTSPEAIAEQEEQELARKKGEQGLSSQEREEQDKSKNKGAPTQEKEEFWKRDAAATGAAIASSFIPGVGMLIAAAIVVSYVAYKISKQNKANNEFKDEQKSFEEKEMQELIDKFRSELDSSREQAEEDSKYIDFMDPDQMYQNTSAAAEELASGANGVLKEAESHLINAESALSGQSQGQGQQNEENPTIDDVLGVITTDEKPVQPEQASKADQTKTWVEKMEKKGDPQKQPTATNQSAAEDVGRQV